MAFGLGAAPGLAANCQDISYATERAKLQRYMSSHDYSRSEQAFLLAGVDRRVKQLRESNLNERGAACGIKAVRAQVLGCMNRGLPSSLPSKKRKTGSAFWGKADVSAPEALVIGMFHACMGASLEVMSSVK
jgi:hypothetical protein